MGSTESRPRAPIGVVGATAALEVKLGIKQREEPVLIQALDMKLPVQALNEHILDGIAQLDELQRDAAIGGSRSERETVEFGSIVER